MNEEADPGREAVTVGATDEPGAIDQGHCEQCGVSLGDWTEDGICDECADSGYNWGGVNAEIGR